MDVKPVTRTSAVTALLLSVLYCLLVLALVRWVFQWHWVSTAVVAVILLAVLILPGFFALRPLTVRGEDHTLTSFGARGQGHLTVPVPVAQLPGLVERVCAQDDNLGLRKLQAQGGRISVGMTFTTWGAHIRCAFRPVSDTESRIVATSRPRMPLEVSGRSRGGAHLSRLFSGVAREVERTPTRVA